MKVMLPEHEFNDSVVGLIAFHGQGIEVTQFIQCRGGFFFHTIRIRLLGL